VSLLRQLGRLAFAAGLGVCALAGVAQAQGYPSRPIRLVVGFAAGGTTDFMARLLADKLREPLGQIVVVENRTGANGALGAEFVAKSEPDGYTLYFTTAGVAAVYPHLRANPSYDPIKDFVGVGLVAFNSTMLVVNARMPVSSATDLATLARQNPGRITIAITGLGSVSHLGLELFQAAAGVRFLQVPYRGASPAMTDLLGGQPRRSLLRRSAVPKSSRTFRLSRSRDLPIPWPTNGPASSPRHERRPRSSPSSMPAFSPP